MTTKLSTPRKTIICPVDFSPSSERALNHAAERYAGDAEIVVLHVGNPGSGDAGSLLKEHLHHFSRYSDMLSVYGCRVRFAVEYGTPSETIITYAKAHNADMIVLGTHGASNISRLLVGSTTETVMRHATCPVLILKSQEPAVTGAGSTRKTIAALSNIND
jgi:nucleotide-binding universal stress UspA family protein